MGQSVTALRLRELGTPEAGGVDPGSLKSVFISSYSGLGAASKTLNRMTVGRASPRAFHGSHTRQLRLCDPVILL